jgi:hypothetical protein
VEDERDFFLNWLFLTCDTYSKFDIYFKHGHFCYKYSRRTGKSAKGAPLFLRSSEQRTSSTESHDFFFFFFFFAWCESLIRTVQCSNIAADINVENVK